MILKQQSENRETAWIRYIRNRIQNKKNFLCLVSGQTGSGKSWTCLSVAEMLDKNFSVDHIVFGLEELMQLINSGDNFPAGTVFVFDEFQISGGARQWQSLTNRLLNSLLSTFRHRRFVLLINSPFSDFIDSQSKKLLHAEWEVQSIDYDTEQTVLKPSLIQYNSRRKQFYYKYLRVLAKNGVAPVVKWRIPKPSQALIDAYEEKKTRFTTELNKNIERELRKVEVKRGSRNPELTEIQKQVLDQMIIDKNYEVVAKKLQTSVRSVFHHLLQCKKKGYNWKVEGKTGEKGVSR